MCCWNFRFPDSFCFYFSSQFIHSVGTKSFGRSQILRDQTFWTRNLWAVQLRITAELVLKDRTGLERPVVAREEKTSRQGQRRRPHLVFSVQTRRWTDGWSEAASERGGMRTSGSNGGGGGSVSVCAECHESPDISSGWRLFHTQYWRRR